MSDSKCWDGVRLGLDVILIGSMLLMQSLSQSDVCRLGELGLLVNKGNYVHRLLGDHVECGLVVNEGNLLPVNSLFGVLFLLHLENVLHKELLQVLVCIIYAHLLKTVVFKIFKTKDIQNTNCTLIPTYFCFEYSSIHFLNNIYHNTEQ